MNIQEAFAQIESTVRAYTSRTADGMPVIPLSAQRPIYMEGPPGVGKTAIMAQLARSLNVGMVSYTMTHHTRQSALGLPVIAKRSYGGREFSVTEYTMSEIVAEVYRHMEATGYRAGILFLDEINSVSETLMPAMLELLQNKRFGKHRLPENWVIVCAGNPERYNRNARALDPVTLDRVRLIRIEPDVDVWQDYAVRTGVHPAVRAYLRMRPEDFYFAEGENIVTPRSWCDLSDMMYALQGAGQSPGRLLFEQYLQCKRICERFSLYCAMCESVSSRFQLDRVVFEGDFTDAEHFASAPFDEALCCAEMLAQRLARLEREAKWVRERAKSMAFFAEAALHAQEDKPLSEICQEQLERRMEAVRARKEADALSAEDEAQEYALYAQIRSAIAEMMGGGNSPEAILKNHVEHAVAVWSKLDIQLRFAQANVNAFAQIAFPGDTFQAIVCRDLIKPKEE